MAPKTKRKTVTWLDWAREDTESEVARRKRETAATLASLPTQPSGLPATGTGGALTGASVPTATPTPMAGVGVPNESAKTLFPYQTFNPPIKLPTSTVSLESAEAARAYRERMGIPEPTTGMTPVVTPSASATPVAPGKSGGGGANATLPTDTPPDVTAAIQDYQNKLRSYGSKIIELSANPEQMTAAVIEMASSVANITSAMATSEWMLTDANFMENLSSGMGPFVAIWEKQQKASGDVSADTAANIGMRREELAQQKAIEKMKLQQGIADIQGALERTLSQNRAQLAPYGIPANAVGGYIPGEEPGGLYSQLLGPTYTPRPIQGIPSNENEYRKRVGEALAPLIQAIGGVQ